MFTGLVEEVGTLARLSPHGKGARASITCSLAKAEPLVLGESVSCAGVCLTVDAIRAGGFDADVSAETLARSNLGERAGRPINLERATRAGARLGGHIVLGHVDDVAVVTEVVHVGEARRVAFTVGRALAPFLAAKGSITLDGVSLTLNEVTDRTASTLATVMLVPHTQGRTTLADLAVGARLNVEVDVLARYVARQLGLARSDSNGDSRGLPAGQSDSPSGDEALLEKLRGGGYM